METEKIIFFRNFFFRSLIIGILFAIFFAIITFTFWDTGAWMIERFFRVDQKEFGKLMLDFFIQIRIVLVFLFLVPALALHWMLKGKK